MASMTSANNNERSERRDIRIRTMLPPARSSFAYPVLLCYCGLRGLSGAISEQNVHPPVRIGIVFVYKNLSHILLTHCQPYSAPPSNKDLPLRSILAVLEPF